MAGAHTRSSWQRLLSFILAVAMAWLLHGRAVANPPVPATPPDLAPNPSQPPPHRPVDAPRLQLPDFSKFTPHKVLKADGLTIIISTGSGIETIALMGIEPPKLADPATQLAERFLTNLLLGESVYLVDHEAGRRLDDKKRRILYVHRAPDGLLANAELIRQGYAREQAEVPYQYQNAMRAYEGLARAAKKGLWVDPPIAKPTKLSEPKAADAKPGASPKDGKPADPAPAEQDAAPSVPVDMAPISHIDPPAVTSDKKTDKSAKTGVTVYASKTGTKYHTASCRYLGKTKDPVTIDEAKKKSLAPCSECKPGT